MTGTDILTDLTVPTLTICIGKDVLAIRRICSLDYMITNTKFSNYPNVFWGELMDKYIDINANSKTVFTDYAMLKLVLYSPHMFLLFCQSKVGVVKKKFYEVGAAVYLLLRKLGPSWYLLPYRCNACWKPAKSKRDIYVTNIVH